MTNKMRKGVSDSHKILSDADLQVKGLTCVCFNIQKQRMR